MAIITKARLATMTQSTLGTKQFSQVLNEAKIEFSSVRGTNTFLSHSHDDLDSGDLDRVIILLYKAGLRLYIDSKDPKMSPFTNATTAVRIKQAIKNNNKFLLLASNKAIESPWCNWELGFGDPHRYTNNIALFPLADNSSTWKGNEYLHVYPRIEETNGSLRVIFPNGTEYTIAQWLALK